MPAQPRPLAPGYISRATATFTQVVTSLLSSSFLLGSGFLLHGILGRLVAHNLDAVDHELHARIELVVLLSLAGGAHPVLLLEEVDVALFNNPDIKELNIR